MSETIPGAPAPEPTDAPLPEGAPVTEPQDQASEPSPDGQQPAQPKTVPLAALHEARGELRKEREARAAYEARMEERLRTIQAAMQRPAEAPAAAPDFNQDPAAHLKHELDALRGVVQPVVAQTQQQAQQQQFANAYRAKAGEFAADTPDFMPAYEHAIQHMQAMERATGIPAAVMEQEIAMMAMRTGRNPGEAIYAFAKASGYAGPKPAEAPLAAAQRGQAATRSAGAGGAPTGSAGMTLDRLASMPLKDLAAMSDEDFKKIAGG